MRNATVTPPPSDETRSALALAQVLFRHFGGAPVRLVEAVAAALVNSARTRTQADWQRLLADLTTDGVRGMAIAPGERCSRRLEVCIRVARRALHGSLADPTGGANAFHEAGSIPLWTAGRAPVAEIGPMLFYRL